MKIRTVTFRPNNAECEDFDNMEGDMTQDDIADENFMDEGQMKEFNVNKGIFIEASMKEGNLKEAANCVGSGTNQVVDEAAYDGNIDNGSVDMTSVRTSDNEDSVDKLVDSTTASGTDSRFLAVDGATNMCKYKDMSGAMEYIRLKCGTSRATTLSTKFSITWFREWRIYRWRMRRVHVTFVARLIRFGDSIATSFGIVDELLVSAEMFRGNSGGVTAFGNIAQLVFLLWSLVEKPM